MPYMTRVKEFLDKNGVKYEQFKHRQAFTAQGVAQEQHVSGKLVAKVVVVKADGKYALAVLPAHCRVALDRMKELLGAQQVSLATEDEFAALFPDCELGAMPPFGNLYNVPTLVDSALERDEEIYFQAGTHVDTIKMKFADYNRLVQPKIGNFALRV
jgi:Ala-tRNA(Pro) deacylase